MTDTNRVKQAMKWFYSTVFQEEAIQPRRQEPRETVPALIRTARSLDTGIPTYRQSREAVFVKQGRLLANYEDDYAFDKPVVRYFPTYQSLTDQELRGYFSWRTKLRKGEVRKTSLSFAFLYIYELLNQIGVTDPMDGYRKLKDFQAVYGKLDKEILRHLNRWLTDYIIYYELDPALLADTAQVSFDKSVSVLANINDYDSQRIMEAAAALAPQWLERSQFYKTHREDMDTVIPRVLRRVSAHYSRCKKTMTEQFFGPYRELPVVLFASAVFCDRRKKRVSEFIVDEVCVYRCINGSWFVKKYDCQACSGSKLNSLIKTIDSVMRECYVYRHPVKRELDIKWLVKIIEEEVRGLLAERREAQAKKITIDYTRLTKIRQDAAITQDKLIVEEEAVEEVPVEPALEPPVSEAVETSLNQEEYRLLQCLLYGRDYSWVRSSGLMLSVLVDGINEKLFDGFSDSVLTLNEQPELIEDYIQDLKEMVSP